MFGFDLLLLLVAPFVLPYLVGLKVKSKKRGLIPLLAIPVFSLVGGIALLIGSGTYGHTDATPLDFAAVWLIGMGIYLGFVFTACWLVGRWVCKRKQSAANPTSPDSAQSAHSLENGGTPGSVGVAPGPDAFQTSRSVAGRNDSASFTALDNDSTGRGRLGAKLQPVR